MITRRQLLIGLTALGTVAAWPIRRLAARGWLEGLPQECAPALGAAVDRILPGAVDAGALIYIERSVGRRPFKALRRDFMLAGLEMNRLARTQHRRAFAACTPEQQDAILSAFRAGRVSGRRLDGRRTFEHLVSLTVESYLGDPSYGGNRDQVGWHMAGVSHCWYAPKQVRRRSNLPF